jgi:hypothetical protein
VFNLFPELSRTQEVRESLVADLREAFESG